MRRLLAFGKRLAMATIVANAKLINMPIRPRNARITSKNFPSNREVIAGICNKTPAANTIAEIRTAVLIDLHVSTFILLTSFLTTTRTIVILVNTNIFVNQRSSLDITPA